MWCTRSFIHQTVIQFHSRFVEPFRKKKVENVLIDQELYSEFNRSVSHDLQFIQLHIGNNKLFKTDSRSRLTL